VLDYLGAPVRVGICASLRAQQLPFGVADAYTVLAPFVTAVLSSAAMPLMLPYVHEGRIGALLSAVDAIVLTGGPDVTTDMPRDEFELAVVHAALASRTPVLAVCRGLQIVNVALGGTLLAHIDGHLGGAVRHPVDIVAGSQLASAVGTCRLDTGSLHHQAVDRLGQGLLVSARADDGTVEAVEMPGVLGVQWHPELEPGSAGAPLFDWLVSRARASLCAW
jgi:putative glutamine amidotransferase